MLSRRRRIREALGEGGSATIEFAVIAPVMFLLAIAVLDITKAMILYQQVYNTAHVVAVTASSMAIQPDKSTSLTTTQAQQAMSAIFTEIPWIRSGVETGKKSVTLTSVSFVLSDPTCVPTSTTPCAYIPEVAWSVAYFDPPTRYPGGVNTFTNVTRPCGSQTQLAPTARVPGDLKSLPTVNVVNPDPIVVVDVHYQYTPLFYSYIFSVFTTEYVDFWATSVWAVRSVNPSLPVSQQYTMYDLPSGVGGAGKCLGFD